MIVNRQRTFRGARRIAKIVIIVAAVLCLLLSILWHIIRSDHKLVIEKIRTTALEHLNLKIELDGYQLEWTPPYPLIRFQLRNLSIASTHHPQQAIFRANNITSEFNPWDLLTGDFQAHPLQLDSAWIYLYSDSLDFIRTQKELKEHPESNDGLDLDLSSLPSISVNYLDFHRRDDFKDKWQWVKFSHLQMHTRPDDKVKWLVHLQSSCYFEGLVFKALDGGFLMNTPTEINWRFALVDDGRTLQLLPSSLTVDKNTFNLQGRFEWGNPKMIKLQIATDGITMDEALPLLSDKINNVLCELQIDQPIQTEFSLENAIVPGRQEAIRIAFATHDATVNYKEANMTSATLRGTYSNDCDEDGMGDPLTSCITFDQLDGDIYGALPARLQGVIDNMDDPHVQAIGQMDVDLPRLNPLLTSRGKATFAGGSALVNFSYNGVLENILDAPFDNRDVHVTGNATFDQVRLATAAHVITSPSLSGYLTFNESQTQLRDIDLKWMDANIHLSGRLSKLPEFFFYEDKAIISDLYLHFDRLDLDQLMDKGSAPHKNGHKRSDLDRRLEVLCRRLAENVNGQLLLQFDELHYDTFFLTDLRTRLRLFSPHLEQVADSSMIRLDSLSANYMGDTPIYANLQLSADEIPEASIEVYVPAAVRPAKLFLPKELKIIEGDARVKLNAQATLRSLLQGNGIPADLRYQGTIQFNDLAFQHTDMPASVTHVYGPIRLDGEQLFLDDLHFNYAGAPLILQGNMLHYDRLGKKSGKKALVDLQLKGRRLDLSRKPDQREHEKQAAISPPKLFRSLSDVFQQATGKISIALDAFKINKQTIHPFLLDAQLLPDTIAGQAQYCLQIDSFNLGLAHNSYFKGSALIKNPDAPWITADLIGNLQFSELAELLPSEYIEMRSGKLRMDLQYQSPLYDTLNATHYLLDAEMTGHAQLIDGELYYNYRDFTFADISGHLRFDQRALYIDDLDLKVNGNRLLAEGASSDFFPFFILPDRRANIKLKVSSPYFDFGEFKAPHALGKDRPRKKRQKTGRSYRDTTIVADADTVMNTLKQTAGYIDQLLDRGSLDMSTNFDKVVYEEFSAQEIDGHITLAPDTVQLHNLRMNVANGHLAIAGHISDIIQHEPRMEISVEMDQNNVREIFRQFNNFGQQELGYENIKGIISADLHFTADINSNYNIRPESMHGDLGVKLAGGELIDLKALHKKSGFLFRNRGLDHIILDTLQLHSHIRGSDLYVDNFYLHSSSFDFGAIGRYSLGADNNTRILLTIPIRNFFRRHISLEEMREGRSERKGMNILLEARYRKEKMRLIWRPFILNKDQFKMEEGKEKE